MENYFGTSKWRWLQLKESETREPSPRSKESPGFKESPRFNEWLDNVRDRKSNYLRVDYLEDGEKVVNGSLIYKKSFTEERDFKIFHFYLTTDRLVTIDLELSELEQIKPEFLLRLMDRTENAVDGLLTFLGALLNDMLVEIDQFEEALHTLIWNIRKRNEIKNLERVYQLRHELLLWKNLLIPVNELKMVIEETNFPGVNKGEVFVCTCKRIDRVMSLLNEYEHEMDSIIKLEEVISAHRGNEIMKTLTVITTIFTPVMAFGALWGMNFKNMPELEWRFGYLVSIILITISTFLLYGYLKIKGWTGDLLKAKKPGSFFK
ncbi:magnesium transporter CorA family protein [Niallia sp. XMNu-256]|uniref:magnesium transporter CorA family protein n=1 Tax=Niallia sp. XMNu-256 TaxID=3082444 RepID=UPI0030D27E0C